MTVYNGEKDIRESIDSIVNQTFNDFELIIIDDASTDSTWEIIQSYTDSRIKKYKFDSNRGVGYANNFALQKANGLYFAKLDADDISELDRLEKQVDYLDKHQDISLVSSKINYFPDNENVEKSQRYQDLKATYEFQVNAQKTIADIEKELYWYCCLVHTTIMVRKKDVERVGYPMDLRVGEDYHLFYNMNKLGLKLAKMDETLVQVRISNHSVTSNKDDSILTNIVHIKKMELANFLGKNPRKVAIWGTGNLGRDTYKLIFDMFGIEVDFFIDSNLLVVGTTVLNKEVISPNEIAPYKIIVASSYGKFAISKILEAQGFKHLIEYFVIY
ncbi:glycosyltransferase [Paenibacillus qinlingensis]|nr:glycosyltransferase [Paenibacillus qinlingensis]